VWDSKVDGAYECDLKHADDLGTYQIITLDLDGVSLKVRVNEDRIIPNGKVYISFPEQWLKVYVDEYLLDVEESSNDVKEIN
jgi:glycerol transport system ATP-binding protein